MRGLLLGLVVAIAVGIFSPAVGQAADTSPSLYSCQPRDPKAADPPPQPQLPPEAAATLARAVESNDFKPVCPQGEVPQPTNTKSFPKAFVPEPQADTTAMAGISRVRGGRKRGPRKTASTSRTAIGSNWFSWAYGVQEFTVGKGVNGLWIWQTNEQPYIPYEESLAGAHSLAQLWASNESGAGCDSTAETGWSESAKLFGDVNPHLFVFGFDCNVPIDYAYVGSPNWVQSSGVAFPNMTVTHNDTFHVYGARMDGNNWWFYYDGQWLGYIPHSAWKYHFPSVIKRASAGGEVATPNYSTCADMGYAGLYGGNPGAAMFGEVWYEYNYNTQTARTNFLSQASDPSYYATGNWSSPPNHGYAFRYGGPGWC